MRRTMLASLFLVCIIAAGTLAAPRHQGNVPSSCFISGGFSTFDGFKNNLNEDPQLRNRYEKVWGEKWETLSSKMSHLVMGKAPDGTYWVAIIRKGQIAWTKQYLVNESALGFWIAGCFVPVVLADCGNPAIQKFPCPPVPKPKKEVKKEPPCPPTIGIKPPPEEKPAPPPTPKKKRVKRPCPPPEPTRKLMVRPRSIVNVAGKRTLVIDPGIFGKINPIVKIGEKAPSINVNQTQGQSQQGGDQHGGDVIIDNDNSTHLDDRDTTIIDNSDTTRIDVDSTSNSVAVVEQ